MKFNKAWIDELVPTSLSAEELAAQITMAGLEVDGIEPVAGNFNGVVIGEVVECAQHPDADKLRVTKVNVGEAELLDIVCGAPNCRQGLRVAVATVGAVLPGDFVIKKAKLRGLPSHGMLCSFSELGIGSDHSGIIELPSDAPIGTDKSCITDPADWLIRWFDRLIGHKPAYNGYTHPIPAQKLAHDDKLCVSQIAIPPIAARPPQHHCRNRTTNLTITCGNCFVDAAPDLHPAEEPALPPVNET